VVFEAQRWLDVDLLVAAIDALDVPEGGVLEDAVPETRGGEVDERAAGTEASAVGSS